MNSLLTRSGEQQLHSKLSFRSREQNTTTKRHATDRRSTELNRLPQVSLLSLVVCPNQRLTSPTGDETIEGKKQNKDYK
jgi:hypothetical protein